MEKHTFQAEIKQVLDIVIHSLYTDKDIFLRELLSNAADACEKLRFLQTGGDVTVHQPDQDLRIRVEADSEAGTVTLTDTGIGMTHDELVTHLGTIAHSGSRAFLKQLAEGRSAETSLIGQFGVGFYSAFMVAREVEVRSRSWQPDAGGWRWVSDGTGEYTMEPAPDLPRGTTIVLRLKEDCRGFANKDRLGQIIRRYSNFIPFPIELAGSQVNTVQAIWTRPKASISDEDYTAFYQFIGHDPDGPLYRLHFNTDAPLAIQSLLFVPSRNLETMGMGKAVSEVNLHCRRILVEARAPGLFPEWLRFLRGVVDSEDLPLNISRESMQDSALLGRINKAVTGRFLRFLDEEAGRDPERYARFYDVYGRFLKEGVVNDPAHREALARLLRFQSSALEPGRLTSLAEYIARMPADRKEVYFVVAPSHDAAAARPYFEALASRKIEALFLTDPWDEFVMDHLGEFDGKRLVSAEQSELAAESPAPADVTPLSAAESLDLAGWIREQLGDQVTDVRSSTRLVESPAVVLDADDATSVSMRRILQAATGKREPARHRMEINPNHPVIVALHHTRASDPERAALVAGQLLDNARFAAGILEDPRSMVRRLNSLLETVLRPGKPS